MPPPEPSDHAAFHLRLLDQPFFVRQLKSGSAISPKFLDALTGSTGRFISITTTDEEISIVGELSEDEASDGEEALWRCIKIAGPMDFGLIVPPASAHYTDKSEFRSVSQVSRE